METKLIIGVVILGIVVITMIAKDINDIIKTKHQDEEHDFD